MRPLTADMLAALAAENVRPIMFVALDFSGGMVRLHSGVGSMIFGGNTYVGTGQLGKISTIEEATELQAYGLKLELSGIPNTLINTALSEHYQGRSANIWLGALTAAHTLIADPTLVFFGRMDNIEIQVGDTATLILAVENKLVDWDRPRIRRFNNADQQAEYPGDLGCEFVEVTANKTIFWGKVSSI